jgi:mycothiol synthase
VDGNGEKMSATTIQIRPFDRLTASQTEYAALNRLSNHIRHERLPDDPPIPLEENIQHLQNIPPFIDLKLWATWNPDQSEIIGYGNVLFYRLEENKHLAPFEISILPEHRQQGLGRQFLGLIAETTKKENRRLLLTDTVDRVPAGEAFMTRIGAEKGLETHTNQLRITELDTGLIANWLNRYQENITEFELGFWNGAYPEEKIQDVAELYELTNQQPFGNLEIEDLHMTPEHLRQMEKNTFARGNQRWTFYVIDRTTGKFAGYTETVWNPNRPELLRQDMTGVFPQFRNKGLGRWLKASMLDKVLKERPQVKYVRTGNADTNASMLKINNELGFKPYTAEILWQVELNKVRDYIQTSAHKNEEDNPYA